MKNKIIERLEGELLRLRSGSGLDISCRSHNLTKEEEQTVFDNYTLITDLLKIVQGRSVREIIDGLQPLKQGLSYCSKCQRGFKSELIIKGFCPWDFNDWLKTLEASGIPLNPNNDEEIK